MLCGMDESDELGASHSKLHASTKYFLECNQESRTAIPLLTATVHAFHLSSSCSVRGIALAWFYNGKTGSFDVAETWSGEGLWGHNTPGLPESAIYYASEHLRELAELASMDTFNRLGNALRLHFTSMDTRSADLALLGFIGCLESLFAVGPQETKFRLCTAVALFLGDDADSRREVFARCGHVYDVRSTIAHGDKINSDEERSAIALVVHWVPEAELLARRCAAKVLEEELVPVIQDGGRLQEFLVQLVLTSDIRTAKEKALSLGN